VFLVKNYTFNSIGIFIGHDRTSSNDLDIVSLSLQSNTMIIKSDVELNSLKALSGEHFNLIVN
jgi:hypothetical protein